MKDVNGILLMIKKRLKTDRYLHLVLPMSRSPLIRSDTSCRLRRNFDRMIQILFADVLIDHLRLSRGVSISELRFRRGKILP